MRLRQSLFGADEAIASAQICSAFPTMESFLVAPPSAMEVNSLHAQQELISLTTLIAPPMHTGTQLYALMRNQTRLLPSGCPSLDTLLRGGLREGHLIEVFGQAGSGKTQLCLTATCETLRRGERVLYVDTSNAVSLHRLETMLAPQTASQQPLDGLQVARVYDVFAVLELLDECVMACEAAERTKLPKPVNLLVIDSLGSLLSAGLGGASGGTGHTLVVAVAQQLRALAERFSIAVLVTNAQVGAGSAEGPRPGLGDAWRNQPHVRLRLAVQGEGRLVELLRCTVGRAGEAVPVRLGALGLLAA